MHTLEKPERAKPMDDGKDGKTQIWIVDEGTKKEVTLALVSLSLSCPLFLTY